MTRPDAGFRILARPIVAVICGLLLLAAFSLRQEAVSMPAPAVQSNSIARVDQRRCIECHADIVGTFNRAPHARTLHAANDPEVAAHFEGRTYVRPKTGTQYRYTFEDGQLWLDSPAYSSRLRVDWMFGSGSHAQTPLILVDSGDEGTCSIEHAVSWYPDGQLAETFGSEALSIHAGLQAVGRFWGSPETANCLGCHSSYVPVTDGRLDDRHVLPNIDCSRCHFETAEHLLQADNGAATTIERLSQTSPLEAVERCGECHRLAEDFGGALFPENKALARFAPVSLVQSPCFKQQAEVKQGDGRPARLDCAVCHDPHVGSTREKLVEVSCLNCHRGTNESAPHCSSKAATTDCVTCHMPKVPMNAHLSFTDHWIRVVKKDGATSGNDVRRP